MSSYRRPAEFPDLVQAVEAAREVAKKKGRHFRRKRLGWKVSTNVTSRKHIVVVRVRDPKMMNALKEWLDEQKISYVQAKRFGGKDAPNRIHLI